MADLYVALGGMLFVLSVAAIVRVVATETSEVVYPVLLVVVGVLVSIVGFDPGFRLSSEVILGLLVPAVLFQGAQRT